MLLHSAPSRTVILCTRQHLHIYSVIQVETVIGHDLLTCRSVVHLADQVSSLVARILSIELLHIVRLCAHTVPCGESAGQSHLILVVECTVHQLPVVVFTRICLREGSRKDRLGRITIVDGEVCLEVWVQSITHTHHLVASGSCQLISIAIDFHAPSLSIQVELS